MLRLFPGTCYVAETIAKKMPLRLDHPEMEEFIALARKEEE